MGEKKMQDKFMMKILSLVESPSVCRLAPDFNIFPTGLIFITTE